VFSLISRVGLQVGWGRKIRCARLTRGIWKDRRPGRQRSDKGTAGGRAANPALVAAAAPRAQVKRFTGGNGGGLQSVAGKGYSMKWSDHV